MARLGGDEFVIALWELSRADGIDKPVSTVLHAVSQPYDIQGYSVSITVSIGVSIYPMHGEDGETLMKRADQALYGAKRAGKNDYHMASVQPSIGDGAQMNETGKI